MKIVYDSIIKHKMTGFAPKNSVRGELRKKYNLINKNIILYA